jgi:hypothetical protein
VEIAEPKSEEAHRAFLLFGCTSDVTGYATETNGSLALVISLQNILLSIDMHLAARADRQFKCLSTVSHTGHVFDFIFTVFSFELNLCYLLLAHRAGAIACFSPMIDTVVTEFVHTPV